MRTIDREIKGFFQFQIEGSDEVYKIPLPLCMTNKQMVELTETGSDYDKQVEWLRGMIGDVVDDLTVSETSAIMQGWLEASEQSEVTPGES